MSCSTEKIFSPPNNISKKWETDENMIIKNQCIFDVQYLGSTEIETPNDYVKCCEVLKNLIGKKKLVKGMLKISTFSLILIEKSTTDIKIDQTLKDIIICASHPLIPYAFFYTFRDPAFNSFKLCGFISMREVSDRIINALLIALKFYTEKQNETINNLSNYQKLEQIEHDQAFKQISLREKFQDPQSSIVISNSKFPCSKTCSDLKSIPRPKPGKKNSFDLFPILNQNNLFKSSENHNGKSVDSNSDYLSKEDLGEIFIPQFNDNLSYNGTTMNKSKSEAMMFSSLPCSESESKSTSKYDVLKITATPLASTGWSEEIIGCDKPKSLKIKTNKIDEKCLEFDKFISTFIENSDLKKKLN